VQPTEAMSQDEIQRLPPMLFGRIRWAKGLGAPVGGPGSGFTILVEEHTVSQYQIGPGGVIEVKPGTGVWKTTTTSAPCRALPDEGDMHVVGFDVPDPHLNGFPDGKYRVTPTLTGKWTTSSVQVWLGTKRMEPRFDEASLTEGQHIRNLDFEVVREPWRLRPFG
jgi:hypothetical protein